MERPTSLFLGAGFLTSHLLPQITPLVGRIVLVDRERVEKGNYDNSILPKGYSNRRKVSALAALSQILSSVPVVTIHSNVNDVDRLLKIHEDHQPDIAFVTFDNVPSRKVAREYALRTETPAIFLGVTENYAYVDWADGVVLPETDEEEREVEEAMRRIRDVCTRLEFRPLGSLAASLAFHTFTAWLWNGRRIAMMASVEEGRLHLSTFDRRSISGDYRRATRSNT